jgi:hypothetical protein
MNKRLFLDSIMRDRSYPDAGKALYDAILLCSDCDKIILDFNGISSVPSMFLNVSIGRLISERGVAFIKGKIGFSNITASQVQRIKEYVDRFDNSVS